MSVDEAVQRLTEMAEPDQREWRRVYSADQDAMLSVLAELERLQAENERIAALGALTDPCRMCTLYEETPDGFCI